MKEEVLQYWLSEEQKTFKGWDFSYLKNRMMEEPLPWDYKEIVNRYLKKSDLLLDMGTGGGEFLLTLKHPYEQTYVTEAYPPNVDLCHQKLGPLGIDVKQVYDDDLLPHEDHSFALVINRHESYDAGEVYRVLKPDGLFITQQVGGLNNRELAAFLLPNGERTFGTNQTLSAHVQMLYRHGFTVFMQEEYYPKLRFYDMGALIYFAKIIEWEFPQFSVHSCKEQLKQLQLVLDRDGFIESVEHRFILVARKEMK